jgi:hypothetical protein
MFNPKTQAHKFEKRFRPALWVGGGRFTLAFQRLPFPTRDNEGKKRYNRD